MSTSTLTPSFRQVVADVAARAKAILPATVNGRVESAVKLVLAHDVLFLDNGTIEVGSSSDPLKVYHLQGTTCDCADFSRAPESWCKHRLAAGIAKRVQQELARSTPVETAVVLPEEMEPYPDNEWPDEAPRPPLTCPDAPAETAAADSAPPQQPGAALPEAPVSIVRRIGDGEECYQGNQECWDFLYTPTLSLPAMA